MPTLKRDQEECGPRVRTSMATVRRASYQHSSEVRREVRTENPGEPCVYPALRREKMSKKGGAV